MTLRHEPTHGGKGSESVPFAHGLVPRCHRAARRRSHRPRRAGALEVTAVGMTLVLSLLFWIPGRASAQVGTTPQPPGFDDFGEWETLSPTGDRGGLSPDGRWIAYGINRVDGENELRLTNLGDRTTEVIAYGAQPVYSANSRWIAYRVGQSEAERNRLRERNEPVQNDMGIRNLRTGETWTVEGVESFTFSSDGAYLAMRRYPPERSRGGAAGGSGEAGQSLGGDGTPGATVLVRDLGSGRDMTFGNVSELAWTPVDDGHLLALVISASDQVGNGVQLFDPGSGELRVLESSEAAYSHLTWRDGAPDLAVFRSKEDEARDGPTEVILTWTGLGGNETAQLYDPTEDPNFPRSMRIAPFRGPSWSLDGEAVFFGMVDWEAKPESTDDEGRDEGGGTQDPSTVQVWHWTDVFVMPWQERHAAQDRQRNLLAIWHRDGGGFVQLGQDLIEETVDPIPGTDFAWVAEWSKYAMERSIGRPGADLYLLDMRTGERMLLKENVNDRYVEASPGGRYLLFMDDDHFWTVDLGTRAVTDITAAAPVSFIDLESDQTSKVYPDRLQKPPFGWAGWTTGDEAVLFYDKYDIWAVAADGSGAERLTDGAAEEVRHRLVRLDRAFRGFGGFGGGGGGSSASPGDEWIDLGRSQYVSLYGEWTKKSGYGLLEPSRGVRRLVWEDKNVGSLAKAEDADVFAYVAQDFDDSPDIFVGGAGLANARQVTETNVFQSQYAWGHSELIDYVTEQGRRLQGFLTYPSGYEPGKKYPMIVYNYELLSQNVHRYVVPSDRSYYNTAVFMSQGYLVLQPDIVFRPRQPGWSVVECIGAAVEKVIDMGVADPERVGIVGHSMGGYNTAFVATHTHGMFAAAVAGAPIIDLVSYYGDHHWSSGIAETDHIETGQERMEVALYEDFQAYVDNSPVFGAHEMTVPLLLEAGDEDGTVAWYQSIELYNVARRAKRNVVMVTYAGEGHGLSQEENQQDYQKRILAWFGHYLKGEPAEPWITEGKSFLEREAEVKRMDGGR